MPKQILNKIDLFAAQYLPHLLTEKVADVHRDLTAVLADDSLKRIAIEFFRGGGKTTWANVIYTLYEICNGSYADIQSISASGGATGLSTKVARRIKKELQTNQLLIADYGIKCGKGTEYFEVKRGDGHTVEVYCRGKGTAIRGSRGLVIIDDPQSWRDCQSAAIMEADYYWLVDDVLPVLMKDQRCVFIGTSISPLSLLSMVKKKKNWTVFEFAIDNPVGSFDSVWPEMFPREFIIAQYEDMGAMSFNAEYRCKPLVSGNPVFREDWIEFYAPEAQRFKDLLQQENYTIMTGDTAMSKKKINDQTAICIATGRCTEKPDLFVRHCEAGKWSTKEGVQVAINLIREFKPDLVWIECACNPPDVDGWLEEFIHQLAVNNMTVNLDWGHPVESKLHRALGVQGIVQSGRVFFELDNDLQQTLIDDLIVFTGDDKMPDDRVDAIVHNLRCFKDWDGMGDYESKEPTIVRSR